MKDLIVKKRHQRNRRAIRTRAKLHGTAERPRLSVSRTLKHISAQLIDDDAGRTLASATDVKIKKGTGKEKASEVGKLLGESAKKAGIKTAVVDRGSFKYHGRVKVLVDAAGEAGLTYKK